MTGFGSYRPLILTSGAFVELADMKNRFTARSSLSAWLFCQGSLALRQSFSGLMPDAR